jgi:UDP-N-acetylmuramoyl-tripeptide--D-alanyl-D-alanine ligase
MGNLGSILEAAAAAAYRFTSDSRDCGPGDIFVALPGSARDGHEFVPAVLAMGAVAVVRDGAVSRLGLGQASSDGRVVEVSDTHEAHRWLAHRFRKRFAGTVVAVGGSSGKTTAKDFLKSVLASRFRVTATERSQNGELGIPKTLEGLRPGIELAVVEVGIDAPGDMERHAGIVAPDVAVLTSVGPEHLARLGDVETVYREETVLFDVTLSRGGRAFAPRDDPWLARQDGREGVVLVPSEPTAIDPRFDPPFRHRLGRRNAALAAAVGQSLNVPDDRIAVALGGLSLPEGRGTERRLPNGSILVLDHYNANPESMKAGIDHARELAAREGLPLRLVLGDMLDLGDAAEAAHRGMVALLKEARPTTLWLVGEHWGRLAGDLGNAADTVRVFPDTDAAADEHPGSLIDPAGVILFKGSRGVALERLLDAL